MPAQIKLSLIQTTNIRVRCGTKTGPVSSKLSFLTDLKRCLFLTKDLFIVSPGGEVIHQDKPDLDCHRIDFG